MKTKRHGRHQSGFTLPELLGALVVLGIVLGAAGVWLRPLDNPLESGSKQLEGFFRQARARALASTLAYRVVPLSDSEIAGEFSDKCSDEDWTLDPALELTLPDDVTLTDTEWFVCFNARGIANDTVVVDLWHPKKGTRQVEVLLGGVSRVLK